MNSFHRGSTAPVSASTSEHLITSLSSMPNRRSSSRGMYILFRVMTSSPTSRRMFVSWFASPSDSAALYTFLRSPLKSSSHPMIGMDISPTVPATR